MDRKRAGSLRWIILGFILVGSMVIHYLHVKGGTSYPSVHAICPFGGLENLWAWFAGQSNIQKIFSGTMVLFFLTVVFALIFRRSFCGNICPLGALQEFLGFFSNFKINVPKQVDRPLRLLKYSILVLSAVMAWVTASLWMTPYDPWAAFSHLFSGEDLFAEFAVGMVILLLMVAVSPFISRAFCKYLCPAGALYAIIGKLSPLKVERDKISCVNCKACSKACPMNIDVASCEVVDSVECISCNRCVDVCPGAGTMIAVKAGKKPIKPFVAIALSVLVFFGSLTVLDALGLYTVSLPSQAEIVEEQNFIQIRDLRGSMTIEQGAFYTGLSLEAFYEVMRIPQEVPQNTPLKYVSNYVPDYDFHTIKARNGE